MTRSIFDDDNASRAVDAWLLRRSGLSDTLIPQHIPSQLTAASLTGPCAFAWGLFLAYVSGMDDTGSNAGDLAVELLNMAEQLIENGEDFEDVRAAFIAVAIRLKQLRDKADNDARDVILRSMR